jgi:heavy metal translocating P-type ATPase
MKFYLRHRADLLRLVFMAIALCLSWLDIWKTIFSFDIIALSATIIGGYPMFKEGYEAIREKRMTMELSMAIAVIATLSIGSFFTGLVITFFVIFAELVESLTVDRGRNVIRALVELLPRTVTVRREGMEQTISVNNLSERELVIIKPGERIPVDGLVVKGTSSADQSSITGESMPVEKFEGSQVFAGTINLNGILEVSTLQVGKETIFGKIIDVVENAKASQAPIERTADKLAARLVYFAFGGALVTLAISHNIVSAISALIVAGACGVAAGTPLAILAGIGRSAREGIIVKGGVYLEQLSHVDTIVLDKTGTLTLGQPQVKDVVVLDSLDERMLLQIAATAEQHSEHPFARAILSRAKEEQIPVSSYEGIRYTSGKGLECNIQGSKILVGNSSFLEEQGIKFVGNKVAQMQGSQQGGVSSIFISKDGTLVGAITIGDSLRSEANQAIDQMKGSGCRVILLTGDSRYAADAVATTLHVDEVVAEMLPTQKLEKVRELQAKGATVAMVGDGINDAPALIEAKVGIAMGTGTDVALESADMALVKSDLQKVVDAIEISKKVMRVIMFNFWGTIAVDTIGVALAFFGFLTPLFAALIHVGSELAFILNSARLFQQRKKR